MKDKTATMSIFFIKYRKKLLVGLSLLLMACAPVVAPPDTYQPDTGTFTLFLQPLPQEADRLRFNIAELVALMTNGTEVPLPLQESHISAQGLLGRQKKLLNASLPPGSYQGLALRIATAELKGETGLVNLLPPQEQLIIAYPFIVQENQTETLFLRLSPERLVTDGVFFTPQFSLWKPERILTNLKGFISTSGSQSLTIFNKRNAQVIGNIRVGKTPTGLVLDQRRNWLYVALTGESAIAVIEVSNGSILGRVKLRFGDEPTELALSANGNRLLALNRGSHSVSIIDTGSFFETGRIRLLSEPNGLFFAQEENQAFVLHTASSTLSVIDLQAQQLSRTVTLETAPLQGAVSPDGRSLYLINDFSSEMLILEVASLTTHTKILIGNGAVSIKADSSSGLLYIGKQDGTIAVVDPRALMAIDSYDLAAGPVRNMTIDNEENALFAVLPKSRLLAKIDLISKRELGRLELEADGYAVAVMGER